VAEATGCCALAVPIKEATMLKQRTLLAAGVALALCACAAPPPRPPFEAQPTASGPKAVPQRNLTHFTDGLRCMDDMLYRFGVRDVSVMIEEMQDQSRRLGVGTRDMMVSAFADMTRRSRGVRLVTFGQDNQNIVQLLSLAQRINDFKVVPQYDVRGSITQFDEDVTREQAGLGASIISALTGPLFGVSFSRSQQSSVMGFDAAVISTADLSLMPGASSKNTVVVRRDETSAGDGLAQIRNSSLSFNFLVSRNEGVAQALRNMVELSTIELTGKLLRLPYWSCLNLDLEHPEVKREMKDWFLSMQGSLEIARFFQEQLRFRKFYDGPSDGKPNAAYHAALAAYRQAVGMGTEGEPDFAVWQAFLLRDIPAPPAQPFVAEKPATADGKPIALSVQVSKTRYRKGEPVELSLTTSRPAYVYCYVQSPSSGKIQRIFPNRFARDPHVAANTPLEIPGEQGFKVAAGGEGAKQQTLGCLATEREIYNDLPPPLRWGDFEDIKLGSFEEIRDAFQQVAKAPVALEGALIEVVEP
jgi:curli biogenesis system outer membrane secretion channel CsgG